MNSVQLVGRLTRDPEVRYSDQGSSVARFTIAVDRRFKQNEADFISCVAFSKTAEFLEKYFRKGQRIGLIGRIQTGSYTGQDGKKVYTTDVVAENIEFVESKGTYSDEGGHQETGNVDSDGFMHIPDDAQDEGLPFN